MDRLNELSKKLNGFFEKKQNKKLFLFILMGMVGILFISLSELFPSEIKDSKTAENVSFESTREYEKFLEERIESEISKISGAGETSVMVTVDYSEEHSYAKNTAEEFSEDENSREYEFLTVENGSYETPVIVKTKEPQIRGILVVCKGGGEPSVRENIIEALCALLDIPTNRISVAKMA